MLTKLYVVYVLTSILMNVALIYQGQYAAAGAAFFQFVLVFLIFIEGHEAMQWTPKVALDELAKEGKAQAMADAKAARPRVTVAALPLAPDPPKPAPNKRARRYKPGSMFDPKNLTNNNPF